MTEVVRVLGERSQLFRLALREVGRALHRRLLVLARPMRVPKPRRLLLAPPDLHTADASIATDIYGGRFVFAGRSVTTGGRSPFDLPVPSHAWAEAFYGFGWLRHLRAADTPLATANARVLVEDFLARAKRHPSIAWRSPVVARRLISFLIHSPLLIDSGDPASYQRLMRGIARASGHLSDALDTDGVPLTRLRAAIALAHAGLACDGYEPILRRAVRTLRAELDRQILADGGHVGRNPEIAVELILDLVPLAQAFATRGVEPPDALVRAIDRMAGFVRLMRHGDGSLAHANGVGFVAPDEVALALMHAPLLDETPRHAPYAGYERLEAGETLVIADVGAAPPQTSSGDAHAGCLAFEMSRGPQRIIVNCGAPRGRAARLRLASRETAAHSTAMPDDLSSARFLTLGRKRGLGRQLRRWLTRRLGAVMLEGPQSVALERDSGREGLALTASHDGYEARYGLRHERVLSLGRDGSALEGEDRFTGAGLAARRELVARFHLHPNVAAQAGEDGVEITLADGEIWRFEAARGDVTIEESAFFAAAEGTRPSLQIVLRAPAADGPLSWRIARLDSPPGGAAD